MQSINLAERPDVRQIRLISGTGYIVDLLNPSTFGVGYEGLGVTFEDTFTESHSSKTIQSRSSVMGEIKFQLVIGHNDDPYVMYEEILRRLNVSDLKFEYTLKSVGTFIKDVAFKSMTKSEITQYGVLACDVVLQTTSLWYNWRTVEWGERWEVPFSPSSLRPHPIIDNTVDKLPPYEELLTSKYRIIYNNSIYMDHKATSALLIEIPAMQRFGGDDILIFMNADGKRLGTFGTNRVIEVGERLHICSDYKDMWALVTYSSVPGRYDWVSDITSGISSKSVGLFRLPVGTTLIKVSDSYPELKFAYSQDDDPETHIKLKIKEEWVTI